MGNKIVDHSDVVGASPTTSSFLSQNLASLDWAKTTARRGEKHLLMCAELKISIAVNQGSFNNMSDPHLPIAAFSVV